MSTSRILSSVSDSSEKVGEDNPMPYATNIVICAWLLLLCIVIVTYTIESILPVISPFLMFV